MSLGLYTPEPYMEIFQEVADYFVVPWNQIHTDAQYPKDIIMDATNAPGIDDILEALDIYEPHMVILPYKRRPEDHLMQTSKMLSALRTNHPDLKVMAHWLGQVKMLEPFQQYLDELCIPVDCPHRYWHSKGKIPPETFWYHEVSSLDLIRTTKPKGVVAKIHISAALRAIDISSRERRPKLLEDFPWDVELEPGHIQLALKNALALKEALQWDTTPS